MYQQCHLSARPTPHAASLHALRTPLSAERGVATGGSAYAPAYCTPPTSTPPRPCTTPGSAVCTPPAHLNRFRLHATVHPRFRLHAPDAVCTRTPAHQAAPPRAPDPAVTTPALASHPPAPLHNATLALEPSHPTHPHSARRPARAPQLHPAPAPQEAVRELAIPPLDDA
ncbi:hypothetical protein GGX14DRAFT_556090 [Mycena pura]|uniref:Uncharacterized protein n=1 Tax=Mycena pura TaxID=153505 RepID=A0AAD7E3C2_9AGAR|nr:hypothetical protein GGX14DRAFT_556090 [Mycena pura]